MRQFEIGVYSTCMHCIFRSGSLIIDFTIFYEFPTSNPEELLRIVGYSSDIARNKSDLRSVFEDYFLGLVKENIKEKVTDKSSDWYAKYGSWGVNPSDLSVWDTGKKRVQLVLLDVPHS